MRVLLGIFVWALASIGSAQTLPRPVAVEFLTPILQRELKSAGDIWAYSGSGGYLMQFDLDVTGDSQPEVFLSSSLDMWRRSANWTANYKIRDEQYQAFGLEGAYSLQTFSTQLWLEKSARGTAIVRWSSDRWGPDPLKWYVSRYLFTPQGITYSREETTSETMEELVKGGKIVEFRPKVYGILLVDFLRDPKAKWKLIDFERATPTYDDYFVAVEDAERVKGLGNFTPTLAWQWHQEIVEKEQRDEVRSTIPDIKTPDAPHTQKTSSPAKRPAALRSEKTSSLGLWLLGIVALLAAMVLFLWLRRASGVKGQ